MASGSGVGVVVEPSEFTDPSSESAQATRLIDNKRQTLEYKVVVKRIESLGFRSSSACYQQQLVQRKVRNITHRSVSLPTLRLVLTKLVHFLIVVHFQVEYSSPVEQESLTEGTRVTSAAPPLAVSNMIVFVAVRTLRASSDIAARLCKALFFGHTSPCIGKYVGILIA